MIKILFWSFIDTIIIFWAFFFSMRFEKLDTMTLNTIFIRFLWIYAALKDLANAN